MSKPRSALRRTVLTWTSSSSSVRGTTTSPGALMKQQQKVLICFSQSFRAVLYSFCLSGVTIRPEDRDALLELLYSELRSKAKQGAWAEVTGVTKAEYLASLVNKQKPTVDVEDIGARQVSHQTGSGAGGVWVPRKK